MKLLLFFAFLPIVALADHNLEYAMQDSRSVREAVTELEMEHRMWCDKGHSQMLEPVRHDGNHFRDPEGRPLAWLQVAECFDMPSTTPNFCTEGHFAGKKIEVQYHWDFENTGNPASQPIVRRKGIVFARIRHDAVNRGRPVQCVPEGD